MSFYKPYFPLFFAIFFSLLGVGATLAALPFYVLGELKGDNVMVGIVIAAIAASAVLTRPIAGRIADRRGYKLIMVIGVALCALAGLAYTLASTPTILIGVRVLHGAGEGMVYTAGAAWLVLLSPPERRGRIVGLYGIHMWAGITLGALVGAVLMKSAGGFTSVWIFSAAAAVVGGLLVLLKPRPDQPQSATRPALLPTSSLVPGVALSLAALGYAALAAFVVLHLADRNVAGGIIAFNAFGVTYVGVRLFLGHLPDKLGAARVALWSALVEAVGLMIIAIAPNLAVAVIGGLTIGAGLSLLFPALALVVINRTDKAQQGAALGAFTSFWDIGLTVGGPLAGFIASAWSYPAIYFVMVGCALASAALALTQVAARPSPRPAASPTPS
jgi:MFS family permease